MEQTMVVTRFSKPEVGSHVTVVTDYSDQLKGYAPNVQRVHTKTGVVVKPERWQDPDTFSLKTDNPNHPVSIISLRYVTDIRNAEGEQVKTHSVNEPDFRSWVIEGSKGSQYTVTKRGDQWGCECKGFQFRGACKHVKQAKEELE